MTDISIAREYMNTMAELLLIMESSPIPVMSYVSLKDSEWLPADVIDSLELAMQRGLDKGLEKIRELLHRIQGSKEPGRYAHTYQLLCWMDRHISYEKKSEPTVVSLYAMLPISEGKTISVGALNDNYRETKIWINPKYDTFMGYFDAEDKTVFRKISNRDAHWKMNGILTRISYSVWDESLEFKNIIIPIDFKKYKKRGEFKVAFTPITGLKDPLVLSFPDVEEKSLKQRGIALDGHKDEDDILNRFCTSWKEACVKKADLFFGPEMMGTKQMYERKGDYLKILVDLIEDIKKEGLTPPSITIMPGIWKNGESMTLLVDGEGRIIGSQRRHIQFIDRADKMVEDIKPVPKREFCIIHLPGAYRIGGLICAEFLPQEGNDSVERLCRDLCCNLLIVPSFSAGEYDYMSSLAITKPYGTSVIWGNCCGAYYYSPRIIGGVSVAGTDYVERMGSYARCGHKCKEGQSCLFCIKLPAATRMSKPDTMPLDGMIEHMLLEM